MSGDFYRRYVTLSSLSKPLVGSEEHRSGSSPLERRDDRRVRGRFERWAVHGVLASGHSRVGFPTHDVGGRRVERLGRPPRAVLCTQDPARRTLGVRRRGSGNVHGLGSFGITEASTVEVLVVEDDKRVNGWPRATIMLCAGTLRHSVARPPFGITTPNAGATTRRALGSDTADTAKIGWRCDRNVEIARCVETAVQRQ